MVGRAEEGQPLQFKHLTSSTELGFLTECHAPGKECSFWQPRDVFWHSGFMLILLGCWTRRTFPGTRGAPLSLHSFPPRFSILCVPER